MRQRTLGRLCLSLVATAALVAALVTPALAQGRNFLWKATRGSGAIYLVGSVHMLTEQYYPLSPPLEAAYKDSDLLVEEVDLDQMLEPDAQLSMLRRGMLPAGRSLDTVVSPATFELVQKRVAGLGLPIEPLKRFKPWALAMTLLAAEWQKAGFDAELGLDRHFYDRARAENKPVQGLETIEFQISRFDGLPDADQDRLLAQTMRELDTQMADVTRLADAWKTGDLEGMERLVLQELKADPRMYERLLVDRNRNWLPRIDALASRPGRAFVVVGAAHLIGPDGLLAMLRSVGFTVEQL
jgi:uncharacterized protein YbaP (TraB family)